MADWMIKSAALFKPLYDLLQQLLAQAVTFRAFYIRVSLIFSSSTISIISFNGCVINLPLSWYNLTVQNARHS